VRQQQGIDPNTDPMHKVAKLQRLFEQVAQENNSLKERLSFIEKLQR